MLTQRNSPAVLAGVRSEEHTSELQSRFDLVCRLLLEKKTSPPDDARRIFSGIGVTYERAGALLSFGQDARWRARLVDSVRAAPGDVVLDVATGTGLVS